MIWVGRNHKPHLAPHCCGRDNFHCPRCSKPQCPTLRFGHFQGSRGTTAALDTLCQCLTTLIRMIFFHKCQLSPGHLWLKQPGELGVNNHWVKQLTSLNLPVQSFEAAKEPVPEQIPSVAEEGSPSAPLCSLSSIFTLPGLWFEQLLLCHTLHLEWLPGNWEMAWLTSGCWHINEDFGLHFSLHFLKSLYGTSIRTNQTLKVPAKSGIVRADCNSQGVSNSIAW